MNIEVKTAAVSIANPAESAPKRRFRFDRRTGRIRTSQGSRASTHPYESLRILTTERGERVLIARGTSNVSEHVLVINEKGHFVNKYFWGAVGDMSKETRDMIGKARSDHEEFAKRKPREGSFFYKWRTSLWAKREKSLREALFALQETQLEQKKDGIGEVNLLTKVRIRNGKLEGRGYLTGTWGVLTEDISSVALPADVEITT